MTDVLIDTHVWAWTLNDDERLSRPAVVAMEQADVIWISPVTVYEISQRVHLGKWPDMYRWLDQMDMLIEAQGSRVALFAPGIVLQAGTLDWPHRDPFDRMIAATARGMDVTLISADPVFDGMGLRRVW